VSWISFPVGLIRPAGITLPGNGVALDGTPFTIVSQPTFNI
jgi:hypothetical protein